MAKFYLKSARGDTLALSEAKKYKLINIDAQTEASASLSSIVIGGVDGDVVNSAQAQPRTVVIDLRILSDVELTKREILYAVKLKQKISLIWEQDNRTLELQGIVESIEMPRWTKTATMQISIHCAQPFWENVDYIVSRISEAIDLHYFTDYPNDMLYFPETGIALGEYDTVRTKRFYNAGDVSVGLEIEILALATVTNPIIYDANGNYFGAGYGTGTKKIVMNAGDVIKINTKRNEKAVTLNGVSIFSKIKPASTWLQLETGENSFAINSDDASITNMQFALTYKQRYI